MGGATIPVHVTQHFGKRIAELESEVERLHDVIARCDGETDEAHAVIVEQGREAIRVREALAELVDAVILVGDRRRYWPRDMRLDGTAQRLEFALDKALAVLGSSSPPEEWTQDAGAEV